jgi:hypothetical protein
VPSASTWAERAQAFHDANPHVYDELVSLCLVLRRKGYVRYSVKGLFEVLRFKQALRTKPTDGEFKLNNNYTAWYARKIMQSESELGAFFEVRARRR